MPTRSAIPETAVRTFPVIEVFGPTIQGEGALAGQVTHFVRFGGCDYRCSWCDSMYAVDPEQVRENAEKLTAHQIAERLLELEGSAASGRGRPDATGESGQAAVAGAAPTRERGPRAPWVTLSGGNPALMPFPEPGGRLAELNDDLVGKLHSLDYRIAVETQGSVWRPWLAYVDMLTVSPKPPSSGMVTPENMLTFSSFAERAVTLIPRHRRSIKIVVFDGADLDYFEPLLVELGDEWDCYLSVGTDPMLGWPAPMERVEARRTICDRMAWLYDEVARRPSLYHCTVLPQLHVLAWGHARAV